MAKFIPVDFDDSDDEFLHVNPNSIVDMRIEYPADKPYQYDVVCTSIADVDIVYTFNSLEEARHFVRRVGGVD